MTNQPTATLSATALEAKRYNHPLDRSSERETPGWFPSQQVQDYLNHAKDASDASSSRLTPIIRNLSAEAFVAIANSDVFSFFLKKFIKHNQDIEIDDMRMMLVVIPSRARQTRLQDLAKLCIEAKRAEFTNTAPPNTLVARTREIAGQLRKQAPAYLHPYAQQILLETPADCLAVLENAVNWEAEKLCDVEALGPFDEF